MILTELEKRLIDRLAEVVPVEEDDTWWFFGSLRSQAARKKLLDWLTENKQAVWDEVIKAILDIETDELFRPSEKEEIVLIAPEGNNRFQELYAQEFYDLFTEEKADRLSNAQMTALWKMRAILRICSNQEHPYHRIIDRQSPTRWTDDKWLHEPEEWDAEMLFYHIVYIFWNRMRNRAAERDEVWFAKEGLLKKNLRLLKEKDSP